MSMEKYLCSMYMQSIMVQPRGNVKNKLGAKDLPLP